MRHFSHSYPLHSILNAKNATPGNAKEIEYSYSHRALLLTPELAQDFLITGLNAAGFSDAQRYELYTVCDFASNNLVISPLAHNFPFQCLGRKPRVEEDAVELYAAIISNNAEVVVTGAPFSSFRDIMYGVDMENRSVEKIRGLEERVFRSVAGWRGGECGEGEEEG